MAGSKLWLAWIMLAFLIVGAKAEAVEELDESGSRSGLELEQLRSKISALELTIVDNIRELKDKDNGISSLQKLAHEKSSRIASLESEIESLQKKGSVETQELVRKSDARAVELEKQVEKLKNEIQAQNRKKDALESHVAEAEKKAQDMSLKLERLQKTFEEQKHRIQKTERALKVAEEELLRVRFEATSKSKELTEVHEAWLPPWLVSHMDRWQDLTATYWKEKLRPTVSFFLQKVSKKSAEGRKWVEPHLETAKTKWIPAAKQQWTAITASARPHIQSVCAKSAEFYEASKSRLIPHLIKAQEVADPYFQGAKKISKPYVDRVTTITKPYVGKAQKVLKPYTKRATRTYKRFLKSATAYHRRVQATVQEKLKQHELTKNFATKELAWFLASGLLALPVFFLYRLLLGACCKKARKPPRNHTSHSHRRHRRRHADK
ncbi:hypothetical protein DsansV1_C13g0120281 [Dioscorea sansibarensis]